MGIKGKMMNMTGKGRGRGDGRRGGSSNRGGRGRGRGKGRGNATISKAVEVFDIDDGDDICNEALASVELEQSSLAQSFEELNQLTALDGFDEVSAGGLWIYPTNRPVRDYQFDIVNTALFHNTLVSLPTGLGKTFISAVVMYNFARWYPSSIVIFMAPTRPLVTQQLEACHNTVGIEKERTVELTGNIAVKKREQFWKTKTVFFLTPQVLLSDIERKFVPVEKIRVLVFDEAHKALGNHAYVQVISAVSKTNRLFRVLALSATPGGDMGVVQQVFKNLLISRVELRSENSPDILPYIHSKKVDVRVVYLSGYVKEVYDSIIEIFQTYSGRLIRAGAITSTSATYSKFQLLKMRETYRKNVSKTIPSFQQNQIESDFNICISLSHAVEMLNTHGLRCFCVYLLGVLGKEKGSALVSAELKRNDGIQNLVHDVKSKLNISMENSTFDFDLSNTSDLYSVAGRHNTSLPERRNQDVDYTLSHPKLPVLKNVIEEHFREYQVKNESTRAIVFSQYRDSVQEIGNMLNSLKPLVKPMIFVGKANTGKTGQGLKQREQIQVVEQFREGQFNVLVATCVAEEGLDIGEVDLIVCFDTSRSPTRLVQRMGRTGRQRDGKTVFILTSGKEEKSYRASLNQHSTISKTITDPKALQPFLYKKSPHMVPAGIDMTCWKMDVKLPSEHNNSLRPSDVDCIDVDEDSTESEAKQKPKTKKPTGSNKGKGIKKTTTSSVKDKRDTTLAKMFERMSNDEPPAKKKKSLEEVSCIPEVVDIDVEVVPVELPQYDDAMDFEADDNIHRLFDDAVENNADDSFYVISKIFDMNLNERIEWTPCTSYYKSKAVPALPNTENMSMSELKSLLVDIPDMVRSLETRESFDRLGRDFCECGNEMESLNVNGEGSKECDSNAMDIDEYEDNNDSSATHFSESFDNSSSTNFSEPLNIPILNSKKESPMFSVSPNSMSIRSHTSGVSKLKVSETDAEVEYPFHRSPGASRRGQQAGLNTDAFSDTSKFDADADVAATVSEASNISSFNQSQSRKENFKFKKREPTKTSYYQTSTPNRNVISHTPVRLPVHSPTLQSVSVAKQNISSPKQSPPTLKNNVPVASSFTYTESDGNLASYSAPKFNFKAKKDSSNNSRCSPEAKKQRFQLPIYEPISKGKTDYSSHPVKSIFKRNYSPPPSPLSNSLRVSPPRDTSRVSLFDQSVNSSAFPTSPDVSPINENRSRSRRLELQKTPERFSDSDDDGVMLASPEIKQNVTFLDRIEQLRTQKTQKPKRITSRARVSNPFIESQAVDSDAGSSDEENFDDAEGLDDSFVSHNESFAVTESQQVMYLESVKDTVPARFGRIEKPLSPRFYGTEMDVSEEGYDQDDSFCQDDGEVDYLDVGVFTQAMNQAKIDLASGSSVGAGRQTRGAKKAAVAETITGKSSSGQSKQRRRVITYDSSSDDD